MTVLTRLELDAIRESTASHDCTAVSDCHANVERLVASHTELLDEQWTELEDAYRTIAEFQRRFLVITNATRGLERYLNRRPALGRAMNVSDDTGTAGSLGNRSSSPPHDSRPHRG